MAAVHVALLNVRSLNRGLRVADSVPAGGETLTSSGTSAADHMVQSGQTFLVTTRGEKIAIKDVL